ncbi:hypothetical protein TREMEDRAFT_67811 [Tremella mesenterica DSM 1558]|uniref:uncharacterized protein n=1 Tax=Tremella mesenterica (strain ATCC 24925 / CBS 8224 / DSM 1558 / NBRC 9311 / NRRL Y-6157 / RJB 2259-6 / UBC 559-6) TaxID=578456 RepID=UPI0003F498B3|nr:uncharacterized protein TREMEDRAFT_67811 [Tremella mesenterica DSM 1558]EIW71519.1 hypothetical protein TREMEDRAFT_67811 [Tremella mesenterica DSM 1558]
MVHVITSKAEFDQILKENEKVVLDAWATWCGPCKLIGPVFAKLEPKFEGIKFVKVDVDEQSEIAQQLQIRAMPTFIAFVGGERFDDFVGAVPKKLEADTQRSG